MPVVNATHAGDLQLQRIEVHLGGHGGRPGSAWPADVETGDRAVAALPADVHLGCQRGGRRPVRRGGRDVLVNEAHATMRNLLLEELDERAVMLTGRRKDLSMVEGIQ